MVSSTESKIAGNYSNSQEALYAADAAVERVVQDLLLIPRWNDILAGTAQSALLDGADRGRSRCPAAARHAVLRRDLRDRPAPGPDRRREPVGREQPAVEAVRLRAAQGHAAERRDRQPDVRRGVDCRRSGRDRTAIPAADANGTLTLHAEALGPGGTHKIIEVTVARTSGTEIERGQIAQRGQEELNQRSRKAAVQTPGKALTNMRMNTSTGNLVVQ